MADAGSGSVLVLRALQLGDLLTAVPALRALRRHWPEQELVLATSEWLRPLVRLIDAVDTLHPATGLAALDGVSRPEVAVNLHGWGPRSHQVLDELRPRHRIGYRAPGWPGPQWCQDEHERERWCRLLDWYGIPADPGDLHLDPGVLPDSEGGAVLVHPGAAYGSKRWPAERFAEVARGLAERGHRVLITGGAAERELAEQVVRLAGLPGTAVLAGDTDLVRLAALVAHADLLVSGDTGAAHLAFAYGTPSITLFGPVSAQRWGPPAQGPHMALSRDEVRRGDAFADTPDPALLGVSVAETLSAATPLLASPPPRGASSPSRGAGSPSQRQ